MARYRKKDKIVRKMDICRVGDYTERVLNEQGESIEERFEDFGIDLQIVSAFSRTGLWDHDPDEHLNLHSSHQIIAVRAGMILVEDGDEKIPLYQNMAAFVPAAKPHRAVLMNENMSLSRSQTRCVPLKILIPISKNSVTNHPRRSGVIWPTGYIKPNWPRWNWPATIFAKWQGIARLKPKITISQYISE